MRPQFGASKPVGRAHLFVVFARPTENCGRSHSSGADKDLD